MRASLSRDIQPVTPRRTSIAAAICAAGDEPIPAATCPIPTVSRGSPWLLVHDGMAVAGAWSFLRGGDCGL